MRFRENLAIKTEMMRQRMTQVELSAASRVPYPILNMGINGRYLFDDKQQARIAAALGVTQKEIFANA